MTKFKFSVVIPVYNAEEYLNETIDSVINQSIGFKDNIELVLVNDGSTDSSLKICQEYQKEYPNNIVIIDQKNAGVSTARNNGIKKVTGEITNCLDSDDKWSSNAFKTVYDAYQAHPDISLFSCKMVYFEKKKGDHLLNYKYKEDKIIDILEDYEYPQLSSSSIFIKTSVIQKYKYDKTIKFSEDNKFINEIILDEKKMMLLKDPTYYYRRRASYDSAIQAKFLNNDWYLVTPKKVYRYLLDLSKEKYGKVIPYIQNLICYELVWRFKEYSGNKLTPKEKELYKEEMISILDDIDDDIIIDNRFTDLSQYVYLLSVKHRQEISDEIKLSGDKILIKDREISKKNVGFVLFDQIYIRKNKMIFYGKLDCKYINKKDFNIRLNDEKIKVEYYPLTNDFNEEGFDGNYLHDYIGINFEVDLSKNWRLGFYSKDEYLYPRFKRASILTESLYRSYHHVKRKTIVKKNQFIYNQNRNIFKSTYYELRNQYGLLRRKLFKALIARITTKLLRLIKIRELWFISDRVNKADDNGEHFFKYMVTHHKNKNIYYVLTKDSPDYERVSKIGKVIDPNSNKYKLLFHLADYVVSSHAENYIFNPMGQGGKYIQDQEYFKYVFLQHGIIKDDLSPWLNVNTKKMDMFVTSSQGEYDSLLEYKYYFGPEVVKLTGLPRYDTLKEKQEKIPVENYIMLSLTWRNGLASTVNKETGMRIYNEDFKNSDYFKFIEEFMNDKKLQKVLKEYNYKIRFIPHPNVLVQLKDFSKNEFVEIEENSINYQDEFCRNKILVTDYSSVFFDFCYLKKPVVYYQADKEDFFAHQLYDEGYFDYETMGFGPVLYDYKKLIDAVIETIKNDGKLEKKYSDRIDKFFKYKDSNNCERVYNAIKEL